MKFQMPNIATLRASTLFYALIISVLIATLSISLISLNFYQNILFDFDLIQEKLSRNAEAGLKILMSDKNIFESNEAITFDLFESGNDSIKINKKHWGLFELVLSESFQQTIKGKIAKRKSALVGTKLDSITAAAIYLVDNKKNLNISGNTQIVGTAYLPKKGVRSMAIDGDPFKGSEIPIGNKKTSLRALPKINEQFIKERNSHFANTNNISYYSLADTTSHSFFKPTLYIREPSIYIENKVLQGNICLIADSAIFVGRNSHLEDVLLYAPRIVFEDHFKGSLQAYAEKGIEIGKQVHLNYPSVVGLLKNENVWASPVFKIQEHALVEGLVFTYNEKRNNPVPQFVLEKNSLIKGQVYINGSAQIYGNVYGCLIVEKLNALINGKIYESHLSNVHINVSKRSQHYISPFFFESANHKNIVKWLN